MSTLLVSGPALLEEGRIAEATLRLAGGRIVQIDPGLDPTADLTTAGVIAPGLIDLQINGGWGHDFTTDGAGVAAVAAHLPATGVTAFLPTIITSPFADYPRRLAEVAAARPAPGSAAVLGVHLEGPYLNPTRAGAHDPTLLRPIDLTELLAWAADPLVRLVTLAPELPGGLAAVRALRARGVVVSAGHSDANHAEAMAAFAAGVGWGTHLFNAMRPLHHREPGLVGALLAGPVPCGLIADGVHVHPTSARLAVAARGAAGIVLVTDAMPALGMPDGQHRLGHRVVTVARGEARLADGTLAGSIVTLDQAVRNIVDWGAGDLAGALMMATAAPARVLGLAAKGRLAVGADADLVLLDPASRVTHTIIAGAVVYAAAPALPTAPRAKPAAVVLATEARNPATTAIDRCRPSRCCGC